LRKVDIKQLSLHNTVTQLIYKKEDVSENDMKLIDSLRKGKDFFSLTIGTKDISLIISTEEKVSILSKLSIPPRIQ
jgi:hypothetical protein